VSRQQAAQAIHRHAEELAGVARDLADQAAAAATAPEEARQATGCPSRLGAFG
jgi:hypothetical protein